MITSRCYFIYHKAIILLSLSLFLFISCTKRSEDTPGNKKKAATIQIKGSDTMVNVAQAWAEEYKNINPSINIEVSGGGSGVGIAALTRGSVDLATASRNMKAQEKAAAHKNTGKNPVEFIVGYDALAIYVHKDNPINNITIEQLKEIYSENGKITRWSQLGISIPGVKNDKIVLTSRQSSSGTYEFFREHILNKNDFKLGTLDMNGSKEVVELISHAKTAIGYSGMGYATDGVKMLGIQKSPELLPVAATIENAQNNLYPLSRSLLIYTLDQPEGAKKQFLDWVMTEAGQRIVLQNGYVPLLTTNQQTL